MEKKLDFLKRILKESNYTVALCGSGMLMENDYYPLQSQERAYEIESKYGAGAEEMFTSAYYNTRPEQFFQFYRTEVLRNLGPGESAYALARMEKAGDIQCVITANVYEMAQRAGCSHVINLHGSIYDNKCPRCGKSYDLDYIMKSRKVPLCEKCKITIRPGVLLYGEMMDSRIVETSTREVEKADVLLLLGTSMNSYVYQTYVRYFTGKYLVIIHKNQNITDEKADLVIYDHPKNVLTQLGY